MARELVVYYDVINDVLYDADGAQVRSSLSPFVFYREKPMIHLQLVQSNAQDSVGVFTDVYTALSDAYDASVVIDNDWSGATNAFCDTDDALINVATEWKEGGTADKSDGEFSIPLDADNNDYNDRISTLQKITSTLLELQIWDSSDLVGVFSFPFHVYNLMDRGGTPAGAAGHYLGNLAADPDNPVEGDEWYNTTTHLRRSYNGTAIYTIDWTSD